MEAAVFFAVVLFAMGGVTAYMGDRLGSYIGKKRHSSFGLRPRHTAMLWTVMSGGGIAVGTLLALLVLDKEFKTALLRGPQLITDNRMLEHQNQALTRRSLLNERQAEADGQRAAQMQQTAEQAQKTLATVSAELGQSRDTLARSRTALQQRQADLALAQRQFAAASMGLGHTRKELTGAEERVRAARRSVQMAQHQYQIASSQVVQANKSVLDLVIKQDRLHAENGLLIRQNAAQQSQVQASQGHPLIYRREEELDRTVIAANQPLDVLRRKLAGFLDGLELTARKRGAGGQDNAPAVIIPALGEGVGTTSAAREAALDALSQNIAAQSGAMPSIVVVADARYNTFRGEAVKLDLRPYANIMVFPRGTTIATDTLDGSQSEDVILKQLQAFLLDRVRAVALNRGIIPIHDPQSGEPLVGQPIDSPYWLAKVKQIQQVGAHAHITASAKEDTYSADRLDLLHLELNVTPGDVPPSSATSAAVPE